MRRLHVTIALVAVAFTVLIGTGCGSSSKKPSVSFSSPSAGATTDGQFTAQISVNHFQIDAADVGKANKKNKGHLHFALDGGKYDYPKYSGANGKLAQQLGVEGKYSPSVKPSITYKGIPAGKHTLEVYLANNDHSKVGPEAKTSFVVKGVGATVSFVEPKSGTTVSGTFTARVALKDFQIDAADVGKANTKNKGHLHFSLDGGKYDHPKYSGANGTLAQQLGVDGMYSPAVKPTITYTGIPSGKHTLEVYLANNDHSKVGPEAKESLTVK